MSTALMDQIFTIESVQPAKTAQKEFEQCPEAPRIAAGDEPDDLENAACPRRDNSLVGWAEWRERRSWGSTSRA